MQIKPFVASDYKESPKIVYDNYQLKISRFCTGGHKHY